MPNYKNSVIYKLSCKDQKITDCYIGSTCNHYSRKSDHKIRSEVGSKFNQPVYRFIRDNGGWINWDFIILEKYPCADCLTLRIRERYWFEKLNATLNSSYPQRSQKEYLSNPEVKEWKKYTGNLWKQENKENISLQGLEYRARPEVIDKRKEKIDCPCGKNIIKRELKRHERSQFHKDWLEKSK